MDHGEPVRVEAHDLGQSGDRWIEPFLEANRGLLRRLEVHPEVATTGGLHVALRPGSRIGAIPLLSPSTRKVTAGLLIKPRFEWSALGSVLERIGFAVEPGLGGGPLVPGSAREVPPWLLAGPVLRRLEALLEHQRRGFVERHEERPSPRGCIDWQQWATHNVPVGRWDRFPCTFSDPAFDPELVAAMRWTVLRLQEELASVADSPLGRNLLEHVADLAARIGPGAARRPSAGAFPSESAFIAEAVQAMGWVADERGLGGARTLDGLAWDLAVDQVWEAWVSAFVGELALRLGLQSRPRGTIRERLNWQGSVESMGSLAPDCALRGQDRVIWVDAKYKAHLSLLARFGWRGLAEATRVAHRADLHQALAYAALTQVERIDTVLAYPLLGSNEMEPPVAIATLAAGRRRVRLVLAGLPFGFFGPVQRDRALEYWRSVVAA